MKAQSGSPVLTGTYPLPLLSRVAESVYWMARYIERAENVARYIMVNLNLQLDLPMDPANQWKPLIDITGDMEQFITRHGRTTQANVLEFLTRDPENPNSILSCLRAARENARSVRETITPSMWEQINSMYLRSLSWHGAAGEDWPLEDFEEIRRGCHMFQGVTDATMTHSEAWHFVRLGRKLERADQTSRILDVKYFILLPSLRHVGTPYDDIQWSAVLTSVSGFEMYRRKYGRINPSDIAEFLIMDREFPRAVYFCIKSAGESLRAIAGSPLNASQYPSEQSMGILQDSLDGTAVDSVLDTGLHEYLDGLQLKMNAIGTALRDDFFSGRVSQQTQSQTQGTMTH